MSDSLRPHGLLHARLPCPSPTPKACSNSCPSSRWYHPTTSSSVPFSSYLQSFPAFGSFPLSQFFALGGQSKVKALDTQSCPTLCDRIVFSWDSPSKNTGVGCHFLLQGICPTQGLNLVLLHCRQILYRLSYQGKLHFLLWLNNITCMDILYCVYPLISWWTFVLLPVWGCCK